MSSALKQRRNGSWHNDKNNVDEEQPQSILGCNAKENKKNKCHTNKNRLLIIQFIQKFRPYAVPLALIAAVALLFLMRQRIFTTWRFQYKTPLKNNFDLNVEKVPLCTFEQLEQVYTLSSNKHPTTSDASSCWKLSEDIMRIPVDAIQNRVNMVPVGNGCNGAIFRVVLELRGGQQCGAVLKADLTFSNFCQNLWQNPWYNLRHETPFHNFLYTVKCFEAHWLGFSYLGGEYTGAIPFYASRRRSGSSTAASSDDFPSGLVPTWAVVTQTSQRQNLLVKLLNRMIAWVYFDTSHPDRDIVGVIMPFSPMKTLENFYKEADNFNNKVWSSPVLSNYTTRQMAQKILPAAEGLAFAHELGLAFQDLGDHNIGFRINKNGVTLEDAVVFDNTFMGWQDTPSSNVCPESAFLPHATGYNLKKLTVIHYGIPHDLNQFRQAIARVIKNCSDQTVAKALQQQITRSQSAKELVQVLREGIVV